MHSDKLLEEWKAAKETCLKIIDISINGHIHQKQSGKQTPQQFMKVYDVVYRLCSNREMEETRIVMVYKDYKELLRTALLTMTKNIFHERDIYKLRLLRQIWDAFDDIMKRLKHMFAYLNRPFHLKEGKLEDLDRTGMVELCKLLFTEDSIAEYENLYFKELAKIRENGDFSECSILKQFVEVLYKIHLRLLKKENKKIRTLFTEFQQSFLNESKEYYQNKFSTLKEFSPSQYFIQVNSLYESQFKISEDCFGIYSQCLINKIFADQFLESYRGTLVSSSKGLRNILQNRQTKTIKIITDIYKKMTDSIDGFKQPFEAFVQEEISSLILQFRSELITKRSSTQQITFIQKIIKKNNELVEILESSFMKFSEFLTYYKSGVERAFCRNLLQIPIEQILATYIISKLKGSYSTQDEIVQEIRNIINIFSCLENKDMFLFKYIQKISKSILNLKDEGLANHEKFVYYLKMHSGNKFTERIETIFNEYKMSIDDEGQIKAICQKQNLPIVLSLRVFSEGAWPNQNTYQIREQFLPQPLINALKCINIYEKEVIKKKTLKISYLDSKIRWVYFFEKDLEQKNGDCYFDTNCLQAIILYFIYKRRPQKVSLQILEKVFDFIKKSLVRFSLDQLSNGHENILIKKSIQGSIFFQFNKGMKSKKRVINYDTSQIMEEERLFQKNQLNRDRECAIDLNIAKFMKSKKVISFDRLADEIIKMIKVFTPSIRDIKGSVERLLMKDLLARDDKDRNIIKYKD